MTVSVDAFSELLQALAERVGHPRPAGMASSGFEFETDEHVLRCLPHPADPTRYLLEADVCTISPSGLQDAGLLLMLHQLNEAAALSTGWTLLIDTELQVRIQRSLALEGATALQLEGDLGDALERAQGLQQLIDRYQRERQPNGQGPEAAALDPRLVMQRA